ncbi:MAG: hypothetical protein ACW9W4_08020 [Candidatus Nitrosopumilus sp. bin_7KS]
MDEESRYWVIPIIAFISVGLFLVIGANERINTPERYIEPEVIVEKDTAPTGLNPYVEFCTPGGFAPVKIIENSTHSFNHDTCIWDVK